jgi:GNAT superfamily N-acetyltransferase
VAAGPEAARVAVSSDLGRLAELTAELFAELEAARGGPELKRRLADRLSESAISDRLTGSFRGRIVVGTYDALAVGFALVEMHRSAPAASVEALFVERGMRRVGVGEAIFSEVCDVARSLGALAIDVVALPGDSATKSFLEVMGMRTRLLVMNRSL